MLPARSRWIAVAALAAAMGAAGPARADDPEAARVAYDRGAAAFAAKRYAEAANELARADALAPNPVALASAIKAAELADDPVLAMTLADRAELRAGAGEAALAAARRVRDKFGTRAGKLSVRCAAARGCAVTVDAEPFPVDQQRWVKAGAHAIEIASGSNVARHTVTIEGGKTLAWEEPGAAPAPPPEPPKPEPPKPEAPKAEPPKVGAPTVGPQTISAEPRGISPAWFGVLGAITAVAGGVSIWSGVDTLHKHADFQARVTDDPSSGQAAQTRTNILFAVTGAAAIATAAVGIFAVRWQSTPQSPAVAVGPWLTSGAAPGGAGLCLGPLGLIAHARF